MYYETSAKLNSDGQINELFKYIAQAIVDKKTEAATNGNENGNVTGGKKVPIDGEKKEGDGGCKC